VWSVGKGVRCRFARSCSISAAYCGELDEELMAFAASLPRGLGIHAIEHRRTEDTIAEINSMLANDLGP
jgi:hypothetical protein